MIWTTLQIIFWQFCKHVSFKTKQLCHTRTKYDIALCHSKDLKAFVCSKQLKSKTWPTELRWKAWNSLYRLSQSKIQTQSEVHQNLSSRMWTSMHVYFHRSTLRSKGQHWSILFKPVVGWKLLPESDCYVSLQHLQKWTAMEYGKFRIAKAEAHQDNLTSNLNIQQKTGTDIKLILCRIFVFWKL